MLAINDSYSFAAANVIMSIKDNSPKEFRECELLIYHNGISEKNKNVLSSINEKAKFIEMTNDLPNILYEKLHHWPVHVIQKARALILIREYKRVLWLDSDTYVNKPLSYIFEADFEIAFSHNGNEKYGQTYYPEALRNPNDLSKGGSGGVVVFDDSILKHNITNEELEKRANELKECKNTLASIDEIFVSYIAYYYNLTILRIREFNMAVQFNKRSDLSGASLIHFDGTAKPWRRDFVYRMFPRWIENYHNFISIGGSNYPKLDKKNSFYDEDYSMYVLSSVSQFKIVMKDLSIVKDPLFNFDFYSSSHNLRFGFKHLENLLFIELHGLHLYRRFFVISLVMNEKLCTPRNLISMKRFYNLAKKRFDDVNYQQNEDAHSVTVKYQNIKRTNEVLGMFTDLAKSELYNNVFYITKLSLRHRVIKAIIKAFVNKKKYAKLKKRPLQFFDDSRSPLIRLLGRFYTF